MAEIISGRNSVLEALRSEREINRVWFADHLEQGFGQQIMALCKERGIPFSKVDKLQLQKIGGDDNRGVVAEVASAAYVEVEDILALAAHKNEPPLVVILDEVEDPHNLGAIIRTALCAGAHGIVIPKRRSASLNQTVAKISAGAVEHLPVARVSNLCNAVDCLKKQGLWIVGADMDGQTLWDLDLSGPLALVMGSEGQGISKLLKSKCDFIASIPMSGPINSLNVSASAAVLLYEIKRSRQMR